MKRIDRILIAVAVAVGVGLCLVPIGVLVLAPIQSGLAEDNWRQEFERGGSFAEMLPLRTPVRVQHDEFYSQAEFELTPDEASRLREELTLAAAGPTTREDDRPNWWTTPTPKDVVERYVPAELAARPGGFYGRFHSDVAVVRPDERRVYLYGRHGLGVL